MNFKQIPLCGILICSTIAFSGCGMFGGTKSIGQLKASKQDTSSIDLSNIQKTPKNSKKVEEEYKELLELIDDKELKQQIERRIAGVYMTEANEQQVEGLQPGYYQKAILAYRDVLEKYPDAPDNAEVMYQLAKAYDHEGQIDKSLVMLNKVVKYHPNFSQISEVYFRIGDIYFNRGDYSNAERAFIEVVGSSNIQQTASEMQRDTTYVKNAYYMLGWAGYKRYHYDDCLESFSRVLNLLFSGQQDTSKFSKTDKSLLDDTLHAISLALLHSNGAEYIEQIQAAKNQPYLWHIYNHLGDLYLEKERFEDSADTFRAYVNNYKTNPRAPEMHAKIIRAYVKGGFPKQVLPEKEYYVQYYGLKSSFWSQPEVIAKQDEIKPKVVPILKTYIDELARYYHASAQKQEKQYEQLKESGKDAKKATALHKEAIHQFGQAAYYYSVYIATFPDDPTIEKMTYLKAEAHFSSGDYQSAISDYEKVAYQFKNKKYGADAGYATIIAHQKIIDDLEKGSKKRGKNKEALEQQKELAVSAKLTFASEYKQDKRSAAVLTNAAEELFSLNRYEKALEIAGGIANQEQNVEPKLRKTALGIMAHSYFKLNQFADAETYYKKQLAMIEKKTDPNTQAAEGEYKEILDLIVLSVYRQGEEAVKAEDLQSAVNHFLRIKKIYPTSESRVLAQYDAATYLLKLQSWDKAIDELNELNRLYPNHKLAPEFPRKLAYAMEKDERWLESANAYMALHKNDSDETIRSSALFQAATLFEKAGEYETAITQYKAWAHRYEEPFDTRMEARYKLAYLYEKVDNMNFHLYWLRRVIDGDKKGGDKRSDRSRWLGAWANIKYGDYFASEYKRTRLRQPLENSLARKNKFLQDAIYRYEMAADYKILEFVTQSTYKTAELYQNFCDALLNSPLPQGLSGDEVQEYLAILKEQALPFKDLAMELHQGNINRSWQGEYNDWIAKSYQSMALLSPARFDKHEVEVDYGFH